MNVSRPVLLRIGDIQQPLLDGYDRVIQRAVEGTVKGPNVPRVRFVDTNFIIGPTWDASSDWDHVANHASHVEALYLLVACCVRHWE